MPPWDRYAATPTADDAPAAPAGPWAKYAAPVAADKPQPDTMSDVARSGALGVVEGTGALAGTAPDVKHYQDLGLQWALSKGAEKLGIISPEYGAHLRENMQLGPYRDRSQPDPTDEQINPLGSSSINHHVMQALAKIGVNTDAPQTTAGEYARTIGSFLPSLAAAPESVGVKAALKYAALPGATSETAGQLTKGTDAEPYARLAGAIAPGGVDAAMGTLSRIANPTTRMMGKAVAGTTPQEFDAAQNILNESRAANAPVTVPEALSKATNGGTRLPEIQRVIEGSPEGGPIMKQFYADRPQQVDALGQRTFDQIANAPTDPYAVPSKIQEAAQGVVNDADQARTAAVRPLYQSAATDTVPATDMEGLLGRIDGMIAQDKTGLIGPRLEKLRDALIETPATDTTPRVPVTDIDNLDTARKFFRDQIAQPAIAQDAVPKQVSAKMGSILGDLDNMMEQASPDFAAGKQRYQDITNSTVQPLLDKPIGKLADTGDFTKQSNILFNSKPLPGSHVAVSEAVQQIASKDPEAAGQAVRMYLEQTLNKATKGDNQFGAANFVKAIQDPQQMRNIQAALRALPVGQLRADAFQKAVDIMSAMKERLPFNSATAMNQEIQKGLESGKLTRELLARIPALGSPGKLAEISSNAYAKMASGQNAKNLAQVFTTGNVSDLRALAGSGAKSIRGRLLLMGILAKESQAGPQP